jgi:hypothetical protein
MKFQNPSEMKFGTVFSYRIGNRGKKWEQGENKMYTVFLPPNTNTTIYI